jgi:tetratricopeptide (TPR) repeat protein
MGADEAAAFNAHYLTCAECQREIRFAIAVRAGLREATTRPERKARPTALWVGAGLALAAGLAAIVILRSPAPSALARLGEVREPPIYLGATVRGTPGRADSLFDSAMTAYGERRYAAAAAGLRSALEAGEDSVLTEFFLGASLLMANEPREAVASLSHVIAKGETPYLAEAQYYSAKALLRLGRGREALSVLTQRTPSDPVLAAMVSALADSVRRALGP